LDRAAETVGCVVIVLARRVSYLSFFGIFRGTLSRTQIEFAKEEEDPDSEVLEGTEAASVGLYRLNA
jgi:hypothetical protein